MHRLISAVVAVLAGPCLAAAPAINAITRPSADVMLKFPRPGLVSKVLVKDGETVKVGDIVAQLDDEAEKLQVAQLKAEGEDPTRVKAAEAQLAQKRLDLKKFEQAGRPGEVRGATEMEIEHARLDVVIASLSLDLAKFQQVQAVRAYEEAKVRLDRMKLTSPIAGQIEGLGVEEGESVDTQAEVLRIVSINPLWINVAVSMSQARSLRRNDPVRVEFPDPSGTGKAVTGKIIYMPAEADAGSRTLKIRVEVANDGRRPAGEHVKVTFPLPDRSAVPSGKARPPRSVAAAANENPRTRVRRGSGS